MSRLPGPGRDFDDQWNTSRRRGKERAARGEGPWAADKALRDLQSPQQPPSGPKHRAASSDSCVTALGVLGGLVWAITETVRHLT